MCAVPFRGRRTFPSPSSKRARPPVPPRGARRARHTQPKKTFRPLEKDVTRETPQDRRFRLPLREEHRRGVVESRRWPTMQRPCRALCDVEENLFTCSQDTQDNMLAVIRRRRLNRIVVAACTPRTHEGLFPGDPGAGRPEQVPAGDGQHTEPGFLGSRSRPAREPRKRQRTWSGWRWPRWPSCSRSRKATCRCLPKCAGRWRRDLRNVGCEEPLDAGSIP